jgi:RNA polymerase sigma factor (sigma-70 family)
VDQPTDIPTDEEAAQRVQGGDREAFGLLLERYESKLRRYGRKFLARDEDIEDITQDVFMKTYENLQSFDTSQKFSPWIYRIAHNEFVNALRKQKRTPVVLVDFDTLLAHPVFEDPVPKEKEQAEMKEMLEQSLSKLKDKYREVLVLYYIEELSYKEIAEVLQVPTGTVGIRIKRAKESLKIAYEKINPEYR